MYLKRLAIVLSFLFIGQAVGEIYYINFSHSEMRFEISDGGKSLLLTAKGMRLELREKKCNAYIIAPMVRRAESLFKSPRTIFNKGKNHIRVQSGGKELFFGHRTREGMFFKNIKSEMQRIIIESKLVCRK